MTYSEWVQHGLDQGYITGPYCEAHDIPPLSETEDALWGEGLDLCIAAFRIGNVSEWEDAAQDLVRDYL